MNRTLICLSVMFVVNTYAMTRVQVRKAMGIPKNQCMQKNGVNDDLVGKIEQGVFIENHDVMCYITCIYKSLQVVKNNKLDMELISKQVDILYPQDLKDPVKKAISNCIHIQDQYNDICEGAFYASKCLYESNPDCFIFP